MTRPISPQRPTKLPPHSPIISHRPFSTTSRLHPPKRWKDYGNKSQYEDVRTKYEKVRNARPLFTADSARAFFRRDSTRAVLVLLACGAGIVIYNGIETVPVSGRRRLNVFPRFLVEKLAASETEMLINQLQSRQGPGLLPDWDPRVQAVRGAAGRLLKAAGLDQEEGEGERMRQQEHIWGVSPEREKQHVQTRKPGSRWRVYVIDDPGTANAFVLPGGVTFVHSGILPIARSEDGLAAVLGHEIAHDVAAHAGEGLTRDLGARVIVMGLMMATVWIDGGYMASWLGQSAMGLLFQRPMNRKQESEADYIGLMMMAGACYDPREASRFWERMNRREQASGESVPEFLSTHPSPENRMESLNKWLPEAERKWQDSDCAQTMGFTDAFTQAFGFNPRRKFGDF